MFSKSIAIDASYASLLTHAHIGSDVASECRKWSEPDGINVVFSVPGGKVTALPVAHVPLASERPSRDYR